jgi:hypothetical protein
MRLATTAAQIVGNVLWAHEKIISSTNVSSFGTLNLVSELAISFYIIKCRNSCMIHALHINSVFTYICSHLVYCHQSNRCQSRQFLPAPISVFQLMYILTYIRGILSMAGYCMLSKSKATRKKFECILSLIHLVE